MTRLQCIRQINTWHLYICMNRLKLLKSNIRGRNLLLNDTKMTKYDLLDQFAKQDQTTVCHVDQCLPQVKQQLILYQADYCTTTVKFLCYPLKHMSSMRLNKQQNSSVLHKYSKHLCSTGLQSFDTIAWASGRASSL